MIKIKVTDEMKNVFVDAYEVSLDPEHGIRAVLDIVERDLNLAVFGLHVDGEYWQVELENKAGSRSGAPGCIEVSE